MSNCDGMQIIIKNQAKDDQGNGIKATIVGLNETRGSLRDLSLNQEIPSDSEAVGKAYSSGGSNGWAAGEIQVKLVWNSYAEVLTLKYEGEKQAFGRECLPHPEGATATYFIATVSAKAGDHEKCTQTFLIESLIQAKAYEAKQKETAGA
ncbi:hypothetical protein [uncultured Roseibium sp.]|uniref:hypothetical protein n=1 Tax=uncultured Roseibium sp. TaxID=1936171 RepID=UPI0032165C6C